VAIKTERDTYACFYCGQEYTHPEKADECRASHELVYLPISIQDVNKLINFVYSTDPRWLEGSSFIPHLQTALRNYRRDKKTKGN
jgi:hypothetical protein